MKRNVFIFLLSVASFVLGYWLGRPALPVAAVADSVPTESSEPKVLRDGWSGIVAHHVKSTPSSTGAAATAANLPLGPFGINVDELKRRADRGDAQAAKALAVGFHRCRFFEPPKTQVELEQRAEDRTVTGLNLVDQIVDQAKAAARKQNVDIGELPEVDAVTAYEQQLAAETDLAANCNGVDTTEAQGWFTWYQRAAELGDAEAELGYWHIAFDVGDLSSLDEMPHRKNVAATSLQRALSRGDWRALVAIGLVVERGYLAVPDPFDAYAWFYAASLASAEDIAVLPWLTNSPLVRLTVGNDTQAYVAGLLVRTARSLDATQIAAAERVGHERFARCCSGRRS